MNVSEEIRAVEVLAFTLGTEEYGINILRVQEIRGYEKVTRVANAPPHVKGVINLRGMIVPIVDMRIKFNLEDQAYNQSTVVVILNLGSRTVGIVVDGVSDVITLSQEQIKPAPEIGKGIDTGFLVGLATLDDRMLILIDIDALMSSQEIGIIDKLAA